MTKITMTNGRGKLEYIRFEMPKKEYVKNKFETIDKGMKPEPRYKGMKIVEIGNKVYVWFNFK